MQAGTSDERSAVGLKDKNIFLSQKFGRKHDDEINVRFAQRLPLPFAHDPLHSWLETLQERVV